MTKVKKVAELKTKEQIMQEVLNSMTAEQKAAMYPPLERKNFVVRSSWLGRNQVIVFTNNKGKTLQYNHDEVLTLMLPFLETKQCWITRKYWSQSTDMPSYTRHLATEVK
jgi:hypothetical protein